MFRKKLSNQLLQADIVFLFFSGMGSSIQFKPPKLQVWLQFKDDYNLFNSNVFLFKCTQVDKYNVAGNISLVLFVLPGC